MLNTVPSLMRLLTPWSKNLGDLDGQISYPETRDLLRQRSLIQKRNTCQLWNTCHLFAGYHLIIIYFGWQTSKYPAGTLRYIDVVFMLWGYVNLFSAWDDAIWRHETIHNQMRLLNNLMLLQGGHSFTLLCAHMLKPSNWQAAKRLI